MLAFGLRHACLQDEQALFKEWREAQQLSGCNWRKQLDELEKQRPLYQIRVCRTTITTYNSDLSSGFLPKKVPLFRIFNLLGGVLKKTHNAFQNVIPFW